MGGLPPLGYDARDRKLIVNEAEAEQVRTIFQRYVELGTVAALKQDLDAQADPFQATAVRRRGSRPATCRLARAICNNILRNRVYIGEITHKGASYPGLHDAIVSPELWQAVQARHRHANRNGTRRKVGRGAGQSVYRPSWWTKTGERLVASHSLKKGRKYRYYISAFLIRKAKDESQARLAHPGALARDAGTGIPRYLPDR